jgi:phosphomannomutase/phosphoglucomutase
MTSGWPEHCFKAYDIRGHAYGDGSGDLTPEFAHRLGRAIASYLKCKTLAVGRDIRESSPALARELIRGLTESGVDVLDLGIVSTGVVYHACWTLPVDGGIMVTASHLPMPTHNGFKMCKGTLPLAGEEIQELKHVFLEGTFREGEATTIDTPHLDAYLQAILASVGPVSRSVKIAVDCGNAVPGPAMLKLLHLLGCEVHDLYCDWDPTEPNHGADPTRPKNMVDLSNVVAAEGCEFGIGCDGDGDRIGAVDERGDFVYPDRLVALMADDILRRTASTDEEEMTVIYDVKCSMNVENVISNAGGHPLMARTGHSFMKRALAERPKCQLAAEMSGHIFPADRGWYGFDCSLYNTARIIELWSRQHRETAFSSVLNQLAPPLPTTGEVKVPCAEDEKAGVVEGITQAFADFECITVDGVRVRFTDNEGNQYGWYLARQSNTEPVLIMRMEAQSEEQLQQMKAIAKERVSPLINIEKLLNA